MDETERASQGVARRRRASRERRLRRRAAMASGCGGERRRQAAAAAPEELKYDMLKNTICRLKRQYCHHPSPERNKLGREELLTEGVDSKRKRMRPFATPSSSTNQKAQFVVRFPYKKGGKLSKRLSAKFYSLKSAVDRKNESGKNEYDRIKDAVKMYEKSEPFQLMHCWEILRNEAKWNEKLLEINTPVVAKATVAATSNPQRGTDNPPMERPKGRDSAKRRRSKEDTTSSSAALEVLQQIHDRNKNTEEKQEQQMQEILNMKGDKIQLTQKMFGCRSRTWKLGASSRKRHSVYRSKT